MNGVRMRQDSDSVAKVVEEFVDAVLIPASLEVQRKQPKIKGKKQSWEYCFKSKLKIDKGDEKTEVKDVDSTPEFYAGWLGYNNGDTDLQWRDTDGENWHIEIKYVHDEHESLSNVKNAFVQQIENALRYGHKNLIVLIADGRDDAKGCKYLNGGKSVLSFADFIRKFRDFAWSMYGMQLWTVYGCPANANSGLFEWHVVQ